MRREPRFALVQAAAILLLHHIAAASILAQHSSATQLVGIQFAAHRFLVRMLCINERLRGARLVRFVVTWRR